MRVNGEGSFPPRKRALLGVGAFEAAQFHVAALDGGVEGCLGVLLAGPDGLEFFVDDVADLDEVAEAQAEGVDGGLLVGESLHGHVGAGVLFIEALLLGELVTGEGDGHVAGGLMEGGLHFGLQDVVEEGGTLEETEKLN